MSKNAKLNIEVLNQDQYQVWNDFVLQNQHATLFHTTYWLSSLGRELTVLLVTKGEEVLGGCALIKTTKKGVTGYHVPPLTPYFGPVLAHDPKWDQTQRQNALALILDHLPPSGVYDFILTPDYTNLLPYIWAGFTPTVRYTYTVNGSVDDWKASINKNKARDYRKAQALVGQGQIASDLEQDLDQVLQLVKQTEGRKKVKLVNDAYQRLFAVKDLSPFWYTNVVKDHQGAALCGSLIAKDQYKCYYLLNGRADDLPKELKNTNLLVMGSAIEQTLSEGKVFDFEGSMMSGIELYFRLLGGVQQPIYRLQKSTSSRYFMMRALNQWRKERASGT